MKNQMKRMLLTLICVITMLSVNAQTVVTVDGLDYSLTGTSASVICVADGNHENTITVPSEIIYNGLSYEVTSLGTGCFCNMYESPRGGCFTVLKGTEEEGAVKSISMYMSGDNARRKARNSSYVEKVILPETIKEIHPYSLANTNISDVVLNEGLLYIHEGAFTYSRLTTIIIPSTTSLFSKTTDTIGGARSTFYGCNLLRTIIYLRETPPEYWTATSITYVPNKNVYGIPLFRINNASIIEMITFQDNVFSYTGKAPTTTWTNNVEGYTATMNMPTLKSDVGNYEEIIPVTFSKGDESFTANIPFNYSIEPAKLTAKVADASRMYGETNPKFSISYSGFVNGENESVLTTRPTMTTTATASSDVGTYPITASGGAAKNYTIEYKQGELTINKASLSIQVMDANKVYGNDNPSFQLVYSGLKNGETEPTWNSKPQFTTSATKQSGAGSYPVTVKCTPKNYNVTSNTQGLLTISKAPLTIKANNASMDYCGAMPSYTYTYSGFVNGENSTVLSTMPSISTTATEKSNAGDYTITPVGAASSNYEITNASGILTIKQRPLIVTANSISRLYGENNPEFTVDYDGFVNNETKQVLDVEPTVTTSANILSSVGSYDLRVSGGRAKNYALTYQLGRLTINPRPLKASVGDYEREYGKNNPTFEIIYEGFAGNDTQSSLSKVPIARTNATTTSDVGTYTIEVTGGYSQNYILSYGSGTLTIVKAEQNFEWNQDLTNLLVGSQVELQAKASSNLPVTYTMDNNDCAEIYTAGNKTYLECKAPGTFLIKAVQNGNDNYYSTQRISKEATITAKEQFMLTIKQADSGSISTEVVKGERYTFTIHTEDGWIIHAVTYNGEDVTSKLDDQHRFTTPAIDRSAILNVVYEQDGSSINAPQASSIRIVGNETGVMVTGVLTGDIIQVYSLGGVLLENVKARSSQVDIPLNSDDVYIVKVRDVIAKLRL